MSKRSLYLTCIVLACLFSACDGPVSSLQEDPMAAPATTAEDQRSSVASKSPDGTTVQRSPVISFYYSTCLGELMKLEGDVQFIVRSGASSNGDGYHEIDRAIYILEGTGLTTGNRYEIREAYTFNQENSRFPFGSSSTKSMQFKVIQPGRGLVFTLRSREHITVDANGEIAVALDQFSGDCKS